MLILDRSRYVRTLAGAGGVQERGMAGVRPGF